MKIMMVFPDHKSEKGISKYSLDLIENIEKQGMKINKITYMQGKPWTLLKQIFEIKNYDVIHIQHEYNLLGLYGLPYFLLFPLIKLFRKKSLIITMHTVPSKKAKFEGSKIKNFLRKFLYICQNKIIDSFSDIVIVHSAFFKKILTEEYGFPNEKVIVFPHAIIEDIKPVDKKEARKQLDLSGGVYLVIGTMIPDHGHDIVLKQADKIGKTILVVTNPLKINYRKEEKIKSFLELNENIVRKNKFENFVRFDLGEIPYEKWWKYFSAADLILLPYRGGVGSGIFADAMAVKKPVIASNVPYFRWIAKDYGCIRIAKKEQDFPKTIKESMEPQNYKKMIKECERYTKENGLTPIAKKYKKLYNSLA